MKRIVLVEDDKWLADSYSSIMREAGYEVIVAVDGHEAIGLVETTPPDGIVADVLLEGQTIVGLLHELQSYDDTARIPVIVCSALTHPELTVERLHHYGVKAVLDKATLTPEKLLETIQEVLT